MYKILNNKKGDFCGVLRSDGTSIPNNENNRDYQEYLKWLAEGNIPEPADQGE